MNKPEYTPYKDALTNAMSEIAKIENSIFIGQQILFSGNPMSTTLDGVSKDKMIEVPVMEESQMGMSLGMAMTGNFVVTFYPRWDFLICATNQLVNHIDKIGLMSNNKWKPNMIIRVGKGSDKPLDPGHQHKGNYFDEFKSMCPNIEFHNCMRWQEIELSYKYAINNGGINLIVEYPELYYSN
jgi:pyruvate/2-oxoglutarate/acetoin dehydrogenase E1 component